MKFTQATNFQIVIMSVLMSIIIALLTIASNLYLDTRNLPIVTNDASGECVRVLNVENGHAFTCNDINITLRRYRVEK